MITIEFAGICTHFDDEPKTEKHRVVMLNMASGYDGNGYAIPAHHASLVMRAADLPGLSLEFPGLGPGVVTWPLDGVTLSIDGPPGKRTYPAWNLYRLGKEHPRWEPSPDVIDKGEGVAAFFDFFSGTFNTVCHGRATGAQVKLDGGNDPHLVFRTEHATLRRRISPAAQVLVKNVASGADCKDDRDHFYLHYLVGKHVPPTAKTPTADCHSVVESIFGGVTLGPGCSNSGYP